MIGDEGFSAVGEQEASEFAKDLTAEAINLSLGNVSEFDVPVGADLGSDVLGDLPVIRPVSEFERYYDAMGINYSLGSSEDWKSFLTFNTEMAKVFGPIFGQYLTQRQGIQAIQSAEDPEKIKAIQALMSANALRSAGYNSGVDGTTLVGLQAAVNNLPADQRAGLMDAAYQQLLAQTTDPVMRQALMAAYAEMKKTWWDTWKWPIIIGSVATGVAVVAFAVKRKEFLMEDGRLGVRA